MHWQESRPEEWKDRVGVKWGRSEDLSWADVLSLFPGLMMMGLWLCCVSQGSCKIQGKCESKDAYAGQYPTDLFIVEKHRPNSRSQRTEKSRQECSHWLAGLLACCPPPSRLSPPPPSINQVVFTSDSTAREGNGPPPCDPPPVPSWLEMSQ